MSRPVPFHPDIQLGGGYGTNCYVNWGGVCDGLIGSSRGYLRKWCREYWAIWFIREKDINKSTLRFTFYSPDGFTTSFDKHPRPEDEQFKSLLVTVYLSHSGEVHGYDVEGKK